MNIDNYIQRRNDMIALDKDRDALFSGIDDMWHGNWKLPTELQKPDLRETVDLSPHDALKSGSAIMSTHMPHWTVQPMGSSQGEQNRADQIAYAIDYNYRRINKRGAGTILWDIVHSALRYDMVTIWLDYLPYQYPNPNYRQKQAIRKGDFNPKVYSPKNVHIQADNLGVYCVLLSLNKTAQAVVNEWPVRTKTLAAALKNIKDDGTMRFIYNDMMIYEDAGIRRIIWGDITDDAELTDAGSTYVIMNEIIATPFMPWVIAYGGSQLEDKTLYSVHPLLAPLHLTHKWKDLNIYQSLMKSEIIKYARSPRVKTNTASGEGVSVDYQNGAAVNLGPGEQAEAWKPAPIDPNIAGLVDRERAEVSATTLPRILQNPEFAGNTPFASINAMIQTALGGLNPAKTLCEVAHQELALRMIEWVNFAGKDLLAWRTTKGGEGKELGKYVGLTKEELDPESVLITCRLFAEAPTDFNQRLNAGILMNQQLKVPRSEVLEELGRVNTESSYDQWVQEQMDDNTVALSIQQEQMALQMQAQQAMQQPPQQPPEQQGGYPSNTQGVEGLVPKGQGYNANVGGMSPAVGNPGVSSREMVSGQDTTGAEIA